MQNLLTKESLDKSYNQKEWQKGYDSQPNEYEYWLEDIEGEIPSGLQGTLFRNGPGLLDIHGTPIKHPFDGDGMINAISFLADGRSHFRNKFVRTKEFVEEQKANKILYRGVFGTQKSGGFLNNAFDLKLKNIANTNVIYWHKKLLALWEAAEPYQLNPQTLETLGIDYLDGILKSGDSFSAHPRIDPHGKFNNGNICLVNFSIRTGISSEITIFEFDTQGKLISRHTHIIPGFAFIHDFVITPHYCIFFQHSITYNPFPYLFGLKGAGECINFQKDKPTRIIVIPRTPPYEGVQIFETQAGFVFHHANAFELENQLYIDSICYQSLPQIQAKVSYKNVDFESLDPGQLWRFTLDLKENKVTRKIIESRCCEFPSLNPNRIGQSYRYLYVGAAHHPTDNAPLQAILKLDLETGERQLHSFAPQGYVSEPIFVSKLNAKDEDDGWVLVVVYDGGKHRSDIVILDAKQLNAPPIATLHLKHHIPYGLHGSWTNECFIDEKVV